MTVRKKDDGRRVAGALVRVVSTGNRFKASAVTDAAGEALVIVLHFPLSHTGDGGQIADGLEAKATVVADPARVKLVADSDVQQARNAARVAALGFPDPDGLAKAHPAPGGGTELRLSTRKVAIVELEWNEP